MDDYQRELMHDLAKSWWGRVVQPFLNRGVRPYNLGAKLAQAQPSFFSGNRQMLGIYRMQAQGALAHGKTPGSVYSMLSRSTQRLKGTSSVASAPTRGFGGAGTSGYLAPGLGGAPSRGSFVAASAAPPPTMLAARPTPNPAPAPSGTAVRR